MGLILNHCFSMPKRGFYMAHICSAKMVLFGECGDSAKWTYSTEVIASRICSSNMSVKSAWIWPAHQIVVKKPHSEFNPPIRISWLRKKARTEDYRVSPKNMIKHLPELSYISIFIAEMQITRPCLIFPLKHKYFDLSNRSDKTSRSRYRLSVSD